MISSLKWESFQVVIGWQGTVSQLGTPSLDSSACAISSNILFDILLTSKGQDNCRLGRNELAQNLFPHPFILPHSLQGPKRKSPTHKLIAPPIQELSQHYRLQASSFRLEDSQGYETCRVCRWVEGGQNFWIKLREGVLSGVIIPWRFLGTLLISETVTVCQNKIDMYIELFMSINFLFVIYCVISFGGFNLGVTERANSNLCGTEL